MHDGGIARMEAAGDIGGGHDAEKLLIVSNCVGAEALAHIRIEIDLHRTPLPLHRSCVRMNAASHNRWLAFNRQRLTGTSAARRLSEA